LPFSYGYDLGARCGEDDSCQDEVAQFINHHFRHEPKLGEELRQKLEEPRYEHLKNMVKNPLCLALLCHTWTLWQQQGGLPDTKAKLYQGFIEKLYNLHNSKSLKTKTQRDQLNRALGELASWALNQQTSRVLLRLDQIPKTLALTLGDVKEEGSLLNLAVGLSWLTNVGLAAENPDEEVYAFFHPTFQEYFASLVMDNDDFLQLPDPESCNSKPASGEYCIFEPQWEEVFLFWSGRKDVPIEQKRNLFIALLNFIDKFNERVNGYKHRAIFLATIGTSEVSEFRKYTVSNIEGAADENSRSLDNPFSVSLTELILKVSIAYSCGYFNPISQKYDFSYEAISKTAKKALLKSDLLVATTLLVSHYWDYVKSDVGLEWLLLFQTASLLGQIAPEKPQSREVLRHFFLNCPSELYCLNLMLELFLARVNRHKLSWVSEDPEILKKFQLLYQILLKKDEDFSSSSEQVMETLKLDFSQLEEADICSKDQLNGLLLFDSLTCRKIYMEAIDALKKRYSQGAKSVSTLEQFCTEKNPVLVRQVAALILATLFSDNSQTLSTVLKTLIDIIRTSDNLYINSMAANSIKQIPFNPKFQPIFVQILEDCWHNPVPSDDRFRYSAFCCFVSYLSEKLPYSDVQQILYS
jgi:hypothetical protein